MQKSVHHKMTCQICLTKDAVFQCQTCIKVNINLNNLIQNSIFCQQCFDLFHSQKQGHIKKYLIKDQGSFYLNVKPNHHKRSSAQILQNQSTRNLDLSNNTHVYQSTVNSKYYIQNKTPLKSKSPLKSKFLDITQLQNSNVLVENKSQQIKNSCNKQQILLENIKQIINDETNSKTNISSHSFVFPQTSNQSDHLLKKKNKHIKNISLQSNIGMNNEYLYSQQKRMNMNLQKIQLTKKDSQWDDDLLGLLQSQEKRVNNENDKQLIENINKELANQIQPLQQTVDQLARQMSVQNSHRQISNQSQIDRQD